MTTCQTDPGARVAPALQTGQPAPATGRPPDPDRYIRRIKGGRYQARPYDLRSGERHNLGTFATMAQARTAVWRFWNGEISPRPKYVRAYRRPDGGAPEWYFVVVPGPAGWQRVGGRFATEAEAAAAVEAHLAGRLGPEAAERLLARREGGRKSRRR